MVRIHRILLSILLLLLIPSGSESISGIPTDYTNSATGRLKAQINTTKTAAIEVTADTYRTASGSAAVTFPTGAMILKISRKIGNVTQMEYIGVESGTTQAGATVTLGTVVRNLSRTDGAQFTSNGAGLSLPAGSIVELVRTVQHEENSVYLTNINTFGSGGAIRGTGTVRSLFRAPPVTETQRDAFYEVSDGDITYNDTTDEFNGRRGGAWTVLGGSGTTNATQAVAGKVEVGTGSDVYNAIFTGDSGAETVVPIRLVTRTSSGSTASGRVMALNNVGVCDVSMGCTGTGGTAISSGASLILQGTSAMLPVYPTTAGNVIGTGDGRSWASLIPSVKNEMVVTAASANYGASSTSENMMQPTWTGTGVDANTLAIGSVIHVVLGGNYRGDAASQVTDLALYVGGTFCASWRGRLDTGASDSSWSVDAWINIRTIGSSGTAICNGQAMFGWPANATTEMVSSTACGSTNNCGSGTPTEITVNTTGQLKIDLSQDFAGSAAGDFVNIQSGYVQVHSAP